MTYCTVDDLVSAYGQDDIAQLTNRANVIATDVDPVVAGTAIGKAEAEINMYLEGRYPLPLPTVPLILTQIAVDISYFYLYTKIGDDHPAALGYARRVKMLAGIGAGRLSLGLDASSNVSAPADTVQIAPGRNDFGGNNW
jgi:phage gp36-like protein